MKFFIDTANINEIKEAAALGILDGVTTNPSLVAKEGKDFRKLLHEILAVVNGPVSAGKESVLFWAVDEKNNDVALKIYLISTSNFKKREQYITGDTRISK